MDPRKATQGPGTTAAENLRRLGSTNSKYRTSVVVLRDPQALSTLVPAWEELAAAALEPNVFYEHWMLLPALEAFGSGKDIAVVLVFLRDPHKPDAPAKLGGLFPLEPVHRFGKLKVSAVSLWQHRHCYVCTPLLRADAARECMVELFRWFRSGGASASVAELGCISGDGPFQRILIDVTNELGLRNCITDIFTRGLWHSGYAKSTDPESAVSGDLRRRLRRKEKRLSERGRVEHVAIRPGDDVGRWIDEFLQIEASGWKGQRGSALASSDGDRRYFTEIVTSAFHRGRLLMLGLDFDGHPIARRCAFVAGEGSFAFKTAYDEEFADFSPGTMLEIDSIRQLHALPGVRWMDSCATTDNLLVNRLSNDRKTIQSVAIGAGALGELLVSGLPLMRWTTRRILKMFSAGKTGDSPAKTPEPWGARNSME
jgi:CelD/BcsL family acetyltransferase involved in cellulose biosynthesis